MLKENSIQELNQKISSQMTPVPAGGTTIALNGALGVSLVKLAFSVSQNEWSDDLKVQFQGLLIQLEKAEKKFLQLMDEDVQAYDLNSKNNFRVKKDLKKLVDVPAQVIENARKVLAYARSIDPYLKEVVKADYEVAVYNLLTCIKGGKSIIESNLQNLTFEPQYIKEIKSRINS